MQLLCEHITQGAFTDNTKWDRNIVERNMNIYSVFPPGYTSRQVLYNIEDWRLEFAMQVAGEPFILIWLYVLVYYHTATHVLLYGKELVIFIKDVLVFYTVSDVMHFNKLP